MVKEEVLNKANELIAEKKFAEAKNVLEEYIKKSSECDIEVHKNLGLCNVNLENYSEAKENFDKFEKER